MMTFKEFLQSFLFEAERVSIQVVYCELFKPSYRLFRDRENVQDNLEEFFNCKKQWPQLALTAKFKDHRLSGGFFEKNKIMECHLASDVLMLYTFSNHTLRLLI